MILHVYEAAKKTNTGEVYVATPDQKIIDVITNHGGKALPYFIRPSNWNRSSL